MLGYRTGVASFYGGPILSFRTNSKFVQHEKWEGDIDIDKMDVEDVYDERLKKATTGLMVGVDFEIVELVHAGFSMQKTGGIFGDYYDISNLTFQFNVSVPIQLN